MLSLARVPLLPRLVLAGAAGAVGALGLAPMGLWPLTLAALAAVPVLLLACSSAHQATWTGWSFATGYFAHALLWIVEPFFVDPDRHAWMAPFALVFMAGGLALFWALAFRAAYAFGRSGAMRVWALVLTLTLAEFARAYVLTGFPWAALGQIWIDTPAAHLLAWIGPHGLGLATLLISFLPGLALAQRCGLPVRTAQFAPALFLAAASFGLETVAPEPSMTGRTVRLVQPNAPQDQKWDPERIPLFFNRQVEFTRKAPHPDLIVWPETAVPTVLHRAGSIFEVIAEAAAGTPVVLGIQRLDGARFYNSLVHLDGTGAVAGIYDKHHLVPFGEYVPLGDLAARFGLHGFAAREGSGYSAGPGPQLMQLGALGRALPLICYEAVFPQDVAGVPGRADLLLQITNDAWFGARSGPYQHLVQARMRALEQGLPMVRVANTGISAMIDPVGRVTASLPLGQSGYVDAPLPAPLAPTLYARSGDLPLAFVVLFAVAILVWRRSRAFAHI